MLEAEPKRGVARTIIFPIGMVLYVALNVAVMFAVACRCGPWRKMLKRGMRVLAA